MSKSGTWRCLNCDATNGETLTHCSQCSRSKILWGEQTSAEDAAVSKALADPRFDREFNRIFSKGDKV